MVEGWGLRVLILLLFHFTSHKIFIWNRLLWKVQLVWMWVRHIHQIHIFIYTFHLFFVWTLKTKLNYEQINKLDGIFFDIFVFCKWSEVKVWWWPRQYNRVRIWRSAAFRDIRFSPASVTLNVASGKKDNN